MGGHVQSIASSGQDRSVKRRAIRFRPLLTNLVPCVTRQGFFFAFSLTPEDGEVLLYDAARNLVAIDEKVPDRGLALRRVLAVFGFHANLNQRSVSGPVRGG